MTFTCEVRFVTPEGYLHSFLAPKHDESYNYAMKLSTVSGGSITNSMPETLTI